MAKKKPAPKSKGKKKPRGAKKPAARMMAAESVAEVARTFDVVFGHWMPTQNLAGGVGSTGPMGAMFAQIMVQGNINAQAGDYLVVIYNGCCYYNILATNAKITFRMGLAAGMGPALYPVSCDVSHYQVNQRLHIGLSHIFPITANGMYTVTIEAAGNTPATDNGVAEFGALQILLFRSVTCSC